MHNIYSICEHMVRLTYNAFTEPDFTHTAWQHILRTWLGIWYMDISLSVVVPGPTVIAKIMQPNIVCGTSELQQLYSLTKFCIKKSKWLFFDDELKTENAFRKVFFQAYHSLWTEDWHVCWFSDKPIHLLLKKRY